MLQVFGTSMPRIIAQQFFGRLCRHIFLMLSKSMGSSYTQFLIVIVTG